MNASPSTVVPPSAPNRSGGAWNKDAAPQAMLVLAALIISTVSILVRFSDVNASASAFWRMIISAVAITGLVWFRRTGTGRISSRDVRLLILSGFFFAGDLALLHVAILKTSVVNATLLNNLASPIAGAILAIMGRRQGLMFWGGGAVALIGAGILAGPDLGSSASLDGIVSGVVSAFFFAGYLVVAGDLRRRHGLNVLLQWNGFAAAAFLLPLALLEAGPAVPASWTGWSAVLGLGLFVQCVGQGLLVQALARVSGPRAGLTVLLAPVFATMLAAWIFAEPIDRRVVAGGLAVLAGIMLSAWPVRAKAASESPPGV